MKRRSLALLAVCAAATIAVGLLVRPEAATDDAVQAAPDESPLRQLSRDAAFRDQAEYIVSVRDALASHVIRTTTGETAIRWSRGGAVKADSTLHAVQLGDTVDAPEALRTPASVAWLVAAARNQQDSLMIVLAMTGGTTDIQCGDSRYKEIVLSTQLPPAMRGAGLFSLGGRRRGMVIDCDNRLVAIDVESVDRGLARDTTQVPVPDSVRTSHE